MLLEKFYDRLGSTFGTPGFNQFKWYSVNDENGEKITSFHISSYWIAEIGWGRFPYGKLVVSVTETDKWRKGLLVIPPIKQPFDREFGGPSDLETVDLSNWDDKVSKSLQSVNLFPTPPINHHELDYGVRLQFGTPVTHGEVSFEGVSWMLESDTSLWKSLLTTIYHLVDAYDNDEIREFTNWKWWQSLKKSG